MMSKYDYFFLDVDGVMTDGAMYYSAEGKLLKKFGPDDHGALLLISKYIKVIFVSADKKGFQISKKRIVTGMNFELYLVGESERERFFLSYGLMENFIYMGDSDWDVPLMEKVGISIAPLNASSLCKDSADYVCETNGGDRAVAEAVKYIFEKKIGINYMNLIKEGKG
jgi:3-deoxy-D-manno-octulosonate 8-phosphate phosphatase (KDO 8-P phosphatase)